jgi:zinc/manganese transport system substrate-binding protein
MAQATRRLFSTALFGLGLVGAGLAPARAEEAKLPVVASFSILGDFVARVGGERVVVTTLVGPNGDAHVYEPTPADARNVAGAKLVVVNGFGFEGWLKKLAKASGTRAPIVEATKGITPREMAEEPEEGRAKGGDGHHDHGAADPHAWQAVGNVKTYVANIRDALTAADPAGKAVYEANAAAYTAEIEALEAEVKAAVAKIPADKRRVITNHDAFGYFAAAYGIAFLAPQGMSTEGEATPKAVAKLIRQIKAEKITAVFIENMSDERLVKRIAQETGVTPGGTLYADALSPKGGPAPTYVDMVRHNVSALTKAMAGL